MGAHEKFMNKMKEKKVLSLLVHFIFLVLADAAEKQEAHSSHGNNNNNSHHHHPHSHAHKGSSEAELPSHQPEAVDRGLGSSHTSAGEATGVGGARSRASGFPFGLHPLYDPRNGLCLDPAFGEWSELVPVVRSSNV